MMGSASAGAENVAIGMTTGTGAYGSLHVDSAPIIFDYPILGTVCIGISILMTIVLIIICSNAK